MRKFKAVIQQDGKYTYLEIPFDPRKEFEIATGTIHVSCKLDRQELRSKLLSRGNQLYWLILSKEIMKKLDKQVNDEVDVQMEIERKELVLQKREYSKSEMNVLEAIFSRRSIRKYTSENVSEQDLQTILNAGFCAPSAQNKRPWSFVVVRNKDMLQEFSQLNPHTRMLAEANLAIVVCGDENIQSTLDYLYEDCSVAIQNMLLAIHSLHLGAVWCGMKRNSDYYKRLRALCELPDKIIPIGMLSLGYPAEEKLATERYDDNGVHFEKWNKP